MKQYWYFIVVLSLFINTKSAIKAQDLKLFESLFFATDTVFLNFSSELFLGLPVSTCVDGNKLIWGEESRFFVFNENGDFTQLYSETGRGPGEFSGAAYYHCDKDRLSIIDDSQQKIISFKKTEGSYIFDQEILIGSLRSRKFLKASSTYVTLNEMVSPRNLTPALTYFEEGKESVNIGTVPEIARLQLSIRGAGGITIGRNNDIYYSYLGDHRIWKWNIGEINTSTFESKPAFFPDIDITHFESINDDLVERIQFAFEIPRVTALYFLEPDILVQQFDYGNYLNEGVRQKILLEIWDTKGNKLHSGIEAAQPIAFVRGAIVYFPSEYISTISEKTDFFPAFIGYQLAR